MAQLLPVLFHITIVSCWEKLSVCRFFEINFAKYCKKKSKIINSGKQEFVSRHF